MHKYWFAFIYQNKIILKLIWIDTYRIRIHIINLKKSFCDPCITLKPLVVLSSTSLGSLWCMCEMKISRSCIRWIRIKWRSIGMHYTWLSHCKLIQLSMLIGTYMEYNVRNISLWITWCTLWPIYQIGLQ